MVYNESNSVIQVKHLTSELRSKPGAYISHSATTSDITGGILSSFKDLLFVCRRRGRRQAAKRDWGAEESEKHLWEFRLRAARSDFMRVCKTER